MVNENSLQVITEAKIEPGVKDMSGQHFQFLRQGYFYLAQKEDKLTFNRVVSLRDSWAKIQKTLG
jgi:glutaminyl-tRNA synthetase